MTLLRVVLYLCCYILQRDDLCSCVCMQRYVYRTNTVNARIHVTPFAGWRAASPLRRVGRAQGKMREGAGYLMGDY